MQPPVLLDIDHPTPSPNPQLVSYTPRVSSPISHTIHSEKGEVPRASEIQAWSSPAFLKRKRLVNLSFGSRYDPFTIDDEDLEGIERKRSRFSHPSGQWRFAERSSSQEKNAEECTQDGMTSPTISEAATSAIVAHVPAEAHSALANDEIEVEGKSFTPSSGLSPLAVEADQVLTNGEVRFENERESQGNHSSPLQGTPEEVEAEGVRDIREHYSSPQQGAPDEAQVENDSDLREFQAPPQQVVPEEMASERLAVSDNIENIGVSKQHRQLMEESVPFQATKSQRSTSSQSEEPPLRINTTVATPQPLDVIETSSGLQTPDSPRLRPLASPELPMVSPLLNRNGNQSIHFEDAKRDIISAVRPDQQASNKFRHDFSICANEIENQASISEPSDQVSFFPSNQQGLRLIKQEIASSEMGDMSILKSDENGGVSDFGEKLEMLPSLTGSQIIESEHQVDNQKSKDHTSSQNSLNDGQHSNVFGLDGASSSRQQSQSRNDGSLDDHWELAEAAYKVLSEKSSKQREDTLQYQDDALSLSGNQLQAIQETSNGPEVDNEIDLAKSVDQSSQVLYVELPERQDNTQLHQNIAHISENSYEPYIQASSVLGDIVDGDDDNFESKHNEVVCLSSKEKDDDSKHEEEHQDEQKYTYKTEKDDDMSRYEVGHAYNMDEKVGYSEDEEQDEGKREYFHEIEEYEDGDIKDEEQEEDEKEHVCKVEEEDDYKVDQRREEEEVLEESDDNDVNDRRSGSLGIVEATTINVGKGVNIIDLESSDSEDVVRLADDELGDSAAQSCHVPELGESRISQISPPSPVAAQTHQKISDTVQNDGLNGNSQCDLDEEGGELLSSRIEPNLDDTHSHTKVADWTSDDIAESEPDQMNGIYYPALPKVALKKDESSVFPPVSALPMIDSQEANPLVDEWAQVGQKSTVGEAVDVSQEQHSVITEAVQDPGDSFLDPKLRSQPSTPQETQEKEETIQASKSEPIIPIPDHVLSTPKLTQLQLDDVKEPLRLDRSSNASTIARLKSLRTSSSRDISHANGARSTAMSQWFTPTKTGKGTFTPEEQLSSEETSDYNKDHYPETHVAESLAADSTATEYPITELSDTTAQEGPPSGGFRTALSYYIFLSTISEHFSATIDTVAIVVSSTHPVRVSSGPRDFYQSLYLTDTSTLSKPKLSTAQIFRPFKDALPHTQSGDVILLRDFKVQHQNRSFMLLSTESSAWAVFRHGEDVQIRGPPVELGVEEREFAKGLRRWWDKLNEEGREEVRSLVPKSSMEDKRKGKVHKTKDTTSDGYRLRSRNTLTDRPDDDSLHELRDGTTWKDEE